MNLEENSKEDNTLQRNNSFYEIDLREIFLSLRRNYKLVLPVIFIYLVIGTYDAIRQKDIWRGQFQIVLDGGRKNSTSQKGLGGIDISRLSAFISTSPVNNLNTQVEILKSSSVLMPAFNYIKNQRILNGENVVGMKFENWRENALDVELESGTTVLNIEFKDTNKDLILPTLQKISNIFQEYSIQQSKQNNTQSKNYLENQIRIYEEKSKDSISKLLDFSNKNNFLLPNLKNKKKESSSRISSSADNFNNFLFLMNPNNDLKVEIDKIKQKLKILNDFDNDSESLLPVNAESKDAILTVLFKDLAKLESEIQLKSNIFTENDPIIKNLENTKIKIMDRIRSRSIKELNSELIFLESALEYYSKPRELVSEFRELFGLSLRNSTTLQNLEKELHLVSLQGSRTQVPWKLITKPTLFDYPSGPLRIVIFLQKLIYGIVFSSFIVFLNEIRKNVINNENEIHKIVKTQLLEKFLIKNRESWEELIKLLVRGPLSDKDNSSVALINLGPDNIEDLKNLENLFRKELLDREFIITSDLIKSRMFKYKILLVHKGKISRSLLMEKINRISIQKLNITGYILLE